MSWLLPGFLGAGLAIGLPIILHFLRSKPKAVIRFPTVRFLAAAAIHDTTKHRLLRLLTLLLRCLIIGSLVAGFARPFFARPHPMDGQVMVIAVDNSMSMQTLNRWEERKTWALDQLAELGAGDQAGILLMQPTPAWLVPISGNVDQVRTTLKAMRPGFETTRYMGALRMAGQALVATPARRKTIVWMADEQRLGWMGAQFTETLPPGVKVRFGETAPAPKSQAAITSLRWTHEGLDPALEVKIRLWTPETQMRHLTVKSMGKIVARRTVNLMTEEEQAVVFPMKTAEGAMRQGLFVSMDSDDLAADDTAWLAPRGTSSRTVLYSPGSGPASHFLDHALDALQQYDPDAMTAKPFPDGDWPAGSVAVATGDCFEPPMLGRLNKFVTGGGALWIVVDGGLGQTRWLAEHGVRVALRPVEDQPAHLRDWDLDHPILGAFAGQSVLPLMQVEFTRSFALEGDCLNPIANWPDGSAGLAEMTSQAGRMFIDGFPLDRSATNWPVQPSFVPFVHQTLRWLASMGETKTDWRVGDTIPLPDGVGTWHTVDSPRAQTDIQVSGSIRPAIPGLYEFTSGKTQKYFAVNTPLGESDLAPWPDPDQLTSFESKADGETEQRANFNAIKMSDEQTESQQRLWWWLLAIVGAALLAELAVANRTAM